MYTNFTDLEVNKIKADQSLIEGIGDGFDKVVELAISANITLTDEQARGRVFLITPASAKTVTLNMKSGKIFLVVNLAAFDITLASGTGSATATASKTALFFCDGANTVTKISADV